jgi:hypothetical protein
MATATLTGFQTLSQYYISKQIASAAYLKSPWLAVLAAMTLGNQRKNSLQIGRPNSGEILSGRAVSAIEKKGLAGINSYAARFQKFATNNVKSMSTRDTMPTVASPTTYSSGQAMQGAGNIPWCHVKGPMLIWHEDKDRCLEKGGEGAGIAMSQLIDEASEVEMQALVSWLAWYSLFGDPTVAQYGADLLPIPGGLLHVTGALTNGALGYANVLRGTNTVSLPWSGQTDTAQYSADINGLLDNANIDKELRFRGTNGGANLCICSPQLYKVFKQQVLNSGGVILQNGMPQWPMMGMKGEVLQKDNCYIVAEPRLIDYTASGTNVSYYSHVCTPGSGDNSVGGTNNTAVDWSKTAIFLDTTVWKFLFHPRANFRVDPWVDLSRYSEGAKDADQSFTHLRFIQACDLPWANVTYTAVGGTQNAAYTVGTNSATINYAPIPSVAQSSTGM